jgi:hypothetical protein
VSESGAKLTAYCGLCCADCIPSNREFFRLLDRLAKLLNELQFEHYAELKAEQHPEFEDYSTFEAVLDRVRQLRCPAPCRAGGGKAQCEVRQCAQGKGLAGCWQCDERLGCARLDGLRRVHPNLDRHLDMIAELGLERWLDKRGGHYRWQCQGKVEQLDDDGEPPPAVS